MLDARYSHLYFCHSLNRLQRGLSAIAELLVNVSNVVAERRRAADRLFCLRWRRRHYVVSNTDICVRLFPFWKKRDRTKF